MVTLQYTVYSVNKKGDSTVPCGEPVEVVIEEETEFWKRTFCVLSTRKLTTHRTSFALTPA